MHLVVNERVTLPAGKYYIGDLCYVLHDIWEEYCDATLDESSMYAGEHITIKGREIVNFTTAYGDGTYQDKAGDFEFWVDSGTIGIIRYDDIIEEEKLKIDSDGMHVLDFPKQLDVYVDEDNVIHFGNIAIPTDDDTVDEEPLYDEDWEDLTEDEIHMVEDMIFSDDFYEE